MLPGHLPLEVFQTHPTGLDPEHLGETIYLIRPGIASGVPQEELENTGGERDLWMDGWMI